MILCQENLIKCNINIHSQRLCILALEMDLVIFRYHILLLIYVCMNGLSPARLSYAYINKKSGYPGISWLYRSSDKTCFRCSSLLEDKSRITSALAISVYLVDVQSKFITYTNNMFWLLYEL